MKKYGVRVDQIRTPDKRELAYVLFDLDGERLRIYWPDEFNPGQYVERIYENLSEEYLNYIYEKI